ILSDSIIKRVEAFIDQQEVTFAPLKNEIKDHIISDIENRIIKGDKEEDALIAVLGEIPENHLYSIQTETLATISTKIHLSSLLSYVSLFCFGLSVIFKLLHLPLTTILLTSGVIFAGLSFFIGGISGARMHRSKKGTLLLYLTMVLILGFLFSWLLQVLSLPGGSPLLVLSILGMSIIFPFMAVQFQYKRMEDNLITYLHASYTKNIELFIIILMGMGALLVGGAKFFNFPPSIAFVIVILAICGSGFHFFFQLFKIHETRPNTTFETLLIVLTFIVFILPALGTRYMGVFQEGLVGLFFILATILSYRRSSVNNEFESVTLVLIGLCWTFWTLEHYFTLPFSVDIIIYSAPFLALSIISLVVFRKSRLLFPLLLIHFGNLLHTL
ncbi:MAG: hypothetical protein RLO81_10085, partial [Fulvivirga sp.]|uniref:hypothetical protein n=1 Tax=Fulvivirga sp. TaxID=1931237 RepID=UPI0032EE607B